MRLSLKAMPGIGPTRGPSWAVNHSNCPSRRFNSGGLWPALVVRSVPSRRFKMPRYRVTNIQAVVFRAERIVHMGDDTGGRGIRRRPSLHHNFGHGHEQRGRNPVARHIADDETEPMVIDEKEIVRDPHRSPEPVQGPHRAPAPSDPEKPETRAGACSVEYPGRHSILPACGLSRHSPTPTNPLTAPWHLRRPVPHVSEP